MEAEVAFMASQPSSSAHTPESLRQRQRDRMSPRRPFGKADQAESTGRAVHGTLKHGNFMSQQRSNPTGTRSVEALRKKHVQEGMRKENSINRRAKREMQDGKSNNVAPDGSSAGREGRQFTVAKVGNNGRIYLRYDKLGLMTLAGDSNRCCR